MEGSNARRLLDDGALEGWSQLLGKRAVDSGGGSGGGEHALRRLGLCADLPEEARTQGGSHSLRSELATSAGRWVNEGRKLQYQDRDELVFNDTLPRIGIVVNTNALIGQRAGPGNSEQQISPIIDFTLAKLQLDVPNPNPITAPSPIFPGTARRRNGFPAARTQPAAFDALPRRHQCRQDIESLALDPRPGHARILRRKD